MSNSKLGIEEILVGKDLYRFKANFAFLQSLTECSDDPIEMYELFAQNKCDLNHVVDVLRVGIDSINDKPVIDKQSIIEDLISRFGLQKCWMLGYQLLSDAMIGTIKKSELQRDSKILGLIEFASFPLASLKSQPLRWALAVWIFGTCLWVNFKLLNPLII